MVKFPMLLKAVNGLFNIFYVLIILRIFMSWIPSIDWEQQPVKFVRIVTDSYLTVFQRFVPPLGGLDFSPIIALFAMDIVKRLVIGILI